MHLVKFGAECFRNLSPFNIEPGAGVNLISGDNGAGKTSLLEAIYFLSRGKSFRTGRQDKVRGSGCDSLAAFGSIVDPGLNSPSAIPVGVRKHGKDMTVRVKGETVPRISSLTALLPTVAIGAESHRLLEDGPELRRRYVDWAVFHMKHPALPAWQSYRAALHQRNAALRARRPTKEIRAWDHALITAGEQISQARAELINAATTSFQHLTDRLLQDARFTLDIRDGWPGRFPTFADALTATVESDRARGFTQCGPHRDELCIVREGTDARSALSRGQQKLVVTAMMLAQMATVRRATERAGIILYDDLPAELDAKKRATLLDLLHDLDQQVFITAIEPELVARGRGARPPMFHVEQGQITRVI